MVEKGKGYKFGMKIKILRLKEEKSIKKERNIIYISYIYHI